MNKPGKHRKAPEAAIRRLSVYLRILVDLHRQGVQEVSSEELAQKVGFSADQIRKDISYFGEFGVAGVGYDVAKLKDHLAQILGIDRPWNVALVGVGNLGSALLAYPGFKTSGFHIVAAFDNDLLKIGKTWENVKIEDVARIPEVVKEKQIKIGIIAVPAKSAQMVADYLINSGVKTLLNFAPVVISVPEQVKLRNVDLTVELEVLSHFLSVHGD